MKGQPLGLELRCLKKFKGAASLVSEEDEKSFLKIEVASQKIGALSF